MTNTVTHGTLADDPEQKVHIITDQGGNVERIRLLPKKETLEDGDRVRFSGDGANENELMQSANKLLKRHDLPEMTNEEFRSTLQSDILGPEIKVNVNKEVDFFNYKRALAKIAYELTWFWLGDSYVDDPQAKIIRDFIINGNPKNSCPFIEFAGPMPEKAQALFTTDMHRGTLEITHDAIICTVVISDIFFGRFVMSLNPGGYSPGFTNAELTNNVVSGKIQEEREVL